VNPDCLVVASCAESGELRGWTLDAARGTLAPRQVVAAGGMLMPMAQHPRLPRLYVARRSDPLAVLTYAIEADGGLARMAEAPLPASMAAMSCDRSGRWLLGASYGAGVVAIGAIDADGRARPGAVAHAAGRNAHCIVADPANRRVFSSALGSDCLYRFELDAERGRLVPAEDPTFALRAGAGPRHLVFDAGGQRLYVLNELDAGIDVVAHDADSGALQPLQTVSCFPAGTSGTPWAAELRLSPDGRWLLATERRSSTVSVFAVEAGGLLSLAQRQATEAQPRGAAWSPDGRHLLVAGQASHHLACLHWDAAAARLDRTDRVPAGRDPNWIETRPLAAAKDPA
jgi:6-phosphogluconolactonase